MKKLILLLSIITICYACKKESVEPSTFKSTQSVYDQCSDSGICSEAYYQSSSTIQPSGQYDTIIHKTGTNELGQVKLTFKGYGSDNSVIQDTFMYKVNIVDFDPNIMDTSLLFTRYTSKGNTIQFFGLLTKSGKWCIFRFKNY